MGVGAGSTLESDADVAAMTDASPEDFGKRGKNASLPSQAAPYGAMRDGGESQRVPLRTCAWLGGSHGVPFTRASPRRNRWDTAKKGNRMLAPTFDYRQSLKLLRSEIETLNGRIAALLPAQWHQESHCPGWSVADLVMHVVRNGEAFLQFSQRMLADDDTPVCGFGYPDPREVALAGPEGAPRDVAIRNLGPRGCAALQAQQLEDYVALLGGLSEMEQRKTGLWAGMCQRTAPWGCRQRLAEVAYHHWDLRCSLGEEAPLDASVAREVLTYRLEPSHSPLFRWRPADGAAVQTVRLRCTTDGTAWRISVSAEAVPAVELGWEVPPLPRPGRRLEPDATGPADVELAADIGGLTLALSGRGQLDGPHFQLAGPRDAEQRFRAAFTG